MKFKEGDKVQHRMLGNVGVVNWVIQRSDYPFGVKWDNGVYCDYMGEELELVQPEVKNMKFKKGDRVMVSLMNGGKSEGTVDKIDLRCVCNMPYSVILDDFLQLWCGENELELIQPEANGGDQYDPDAICSHAASPQEPVLGKYYKTRFGIKLLYVGRGNLDKFVYQEEGGYFKNYVLPFNYFDDCSESAWDIVGKWVDEEPASGPKIGTIESFGAWTANVTPAMKEPMPIIGKLYKSPAGNKLRYIGLCRRGYVFESPKSGTLYIFQQHRFNDMSELVDEVVLPAVEVKSWAIVATTEPGRGGVNYVDYDLSVIEHKIKNIYGTERFEVVELTGTLPARKAKADSTQVKWDAFKDENPVLFPDCGDGPDTDDA